MLTKLAKLISSDEGEKSLRRSYDKSLGNINGYNPKVSFGNRDGEAILKVDTRRFANDAKANAKAWYIPAQKEWDQKVIAGHKKYLAPSKVIQSGAKIGLAGGAFGAGIGGMLGGRFRIPAALLGAGLSGYLGNKLGRYAKNKEHQRFYKKYKEDGESVLRDVAAIPNDLGYVMAANTMRSRLNGLAVKNALNRG